MLAAWAQPALPMFGSPCPDQFRGGSNAAGRFGGVLEERQCPRVVRQELAVCLRPNNVSLGSFRRSGGLQSRWRVLAARQHGQGEQDGYQAVRGRESRSHVREKYRHKDARGRHQQIVMTGPGPSGGDSGKPWQGYDPTQAGRHWAVPQRGLQHLRDEGIPVPRRLHAQLDALLEQGLVYIPRKANGSTGVPRFKLYLKGGQPVQDIILDVPPINSQAAERLGYPTQKPMPLLERIIRASSNPGDLVLDPFCGCGTAVDAANRLDRRWAGIDISSFAIDLICERRMAGQRIDVEGTPFSLAAAEKLAREKPFEFESWAIMRMPGFVPNTVQVADGGVDGRSTLAVKPSDHNSRLALAQVKGGKKFVLSQLRDFLHVMESKKAALGVYVTLNPVRSRDAQAQAWKAGTVTVGAEEYPRCQLWSIAAHFEKRRPHLPTMNDPYNGKPLNQGELFA